VEGRGWIDAEEVVLGDRLRRKDGGWARVLAVEQIVLAAPQMVYNFTVAGAHTYFVLEVGVLVHNCLPTRPNGYTGPPGGYKNVRRYDDPPTYGREGTPFNKSKPGEYIYVIDKSGEILVGPKSLKHPQLVDGDNVYGAGRIEIHSDGKMTIDAISGHYIQSQVSMQNLVPGRKFRDYMKKLLTEKYSVDTSTLRRK
jgi:hypothetical protein